MNQSDIRLGYPLIAEWIAEEHPVAATPRPITRPKISEEEQARRRALDVVKPDYWLAALKQAILVELEKKKQREEGWIEWAHIDDIPPLEEGTMIEVKTTAMQLLSAAKFETFNWNLYSSIIAYRVVTS